MSELEFYMKTFAEGLKALAKGVETMAERLNEFAEAEEVKKEAPLQKAAEEKAAPKAEPEPAPAPKAKTVKERPLTKSGRPKRKPGRKPGRKRTSADAIYDIIRRSKTGVSMDVLKKKTGFQTKKIHNIIYKLKKQEKIKSESKGVYVSI